MAVRAGHEGRGASSGSVHVHACLGEAKSWRGSSSGFGATYASLACCSTPGEIRGCRSRIRHRRRRRHHRCAPGESPAVARARLHERCHAGRQGPSDGAPPRPRPRTSRLRRLRPRPIGRRRGRAVAPNARGVQRGCRVRGPLAEDGRRTRRGRRRLRRRDARPPDRSRPTTAAADLRRGVRRPRWRFRAHAASSISCFGIE